MLDHGHDLDELNERFGQSSAQDVIGAAVELHKGKLALVSSFGAEAAALLHLVSKVEPSLPIIMLDTELLFPQTLTYQEELSRSLGLTDVRVIKPQTGADEDKTLHQHDTLACCALRKTEPMQRALQGFNAVLTGRKRFQTGQRAGMRLFETDRDQRLRVNPLAQWSAAQIQTYFETHALPRHPLVAMGYPSIGCAPCTSPVRAGEDLRAGRWREEEREECGIHFAADGTIQRRPS